VEVVILFKGGIGRSQNGEVLLGRHHFIWIGNN